MTAPRHDRGLHAVARVRRVREQDARLGLQLALAELRARTERAAALADRLHTARGEVAGTPEQIVTLRLGLTHLGEAVRRAESDVAEQRLLVDDARVRWQRTATELKAVEQLLERRAARRRIAVARAEAKELDDLAAVAFAGAR